MFAVTSLMRDTITIKRETVTRVDGCASKEWTEEARGSSGYPTTATCRIQDLPVEECAAYGCRSDARSYKIYFDASPIIDVRDRVYFTDPDGIQRECIVVKPSHSFDGPIVAVWKCIVTEYIAMVD